MNLETMKKLANALTRRDEVFVNKAKESKRYFLSENDITLKGTARDISGVRIADYRIPSNFLYILITSKASYLSTNMVQIDVGNDKMNKVIMDVLGDKWPQVVYELIIEASISGCAYIHFWIDQDNNFQYAPVEATNVMPIETSDLIKNLEGVIYQHKVIVDGEYKKELDYFNDNSTFFYIGPDSDSIEYELLEEFHPWLDYKELMPDAPNQMVHGMGEVPFIKLKNNYLETTDLRPVKDLIDAYDTILSGYVNDLEDVQQIFMILKGYEGTDLEEFKNMLRRYRVIKLDSDDEVQGDLSIESIQIPYEARNALLDLLRKRIFEDGQGIDPDPQNFGNSSGTALKHLYDNLELKSSQIEMYFRPGFERLVRAICKHHGFEPEYVNQTWTRNIPSDDQEMAQIAQSLQGIISKRTQIALLPFIDDPDSELDQIEKENDTTGYEDSFNARRNDNPEDQPEQRLLDGEVREAGAVDPQRG